MAMDPARRAVLDAEDLARLDRLAELIVENERWVQHMRQRQLEQQANIAAAVNRLQPGAVGLVQQAVANPDVGTQNFAQWVRGKLAAASPYAKEMLVNALNLLFLAYVQGLADDAAAEPQQASWSSMEDQADGVVRGHLQRLWRSLPSMPQMPSNYDMDGWTRACEDGGSVADSVFAKAERKAGAR